MTTTIDREAINRSELARTVGINVAHISRILSGRRNPSLQVAYRMAEALGLTLDEFYAFIYPNGAPAS